MFAIDESASIFCARVMRGMRSSAIARDLPRREQRRQLLVALGLEQRDEQRALAEHCATSACVGGRTLMTTSDCAPDVAASTSVAPAASYASSV